MSLTPPAFTTLYEPVIDVCNGLAGSYWGVLTLFRGNWKLEAFQGWSVFIFKPPCNLPSKTDFILYSE